MKSVSTTSTFSVIYVLAALGVLLWCVVFGRFAVRLGQASQRYGRLYDEKHGTNLASWANLTWRFWQAPWLHSISLRRSRMLLKALNKQQSEPELEMARQQYEHALKNFVNYFFILPFIVVVLITVVGTVVSLMS